MNESVSIGFAHKWSVSTGVKIYGNVIEGIVCQVHSACAAMLWLKLQALRCMSCQALMRHCTFQEKILH